MSAPIANVHAHLPPVPRNGQYRMGAGLEENSADLWLNTQLPDGTYIACGEPEGWEGIELLTPVDTAGGRDGGLLGPPSVAPRQLTVEGAMVGPNPGALRNRIRDLRTRLRDRSGVIWDQYDFGARQRMGLVCFGTGDFRATPVQGNAYGGVATQFRFTLIAANPPWKYATGTADMSCTGLPPVELNGRTYDRSYDWDYGGLNIDSGTIYATNDGDVEAWPVIVFTGPVDNPIISNDTTGMGFMVSGVYDSDDEVRIDTRTGVVTPSNVRLVGRPFPLVPGLNTVRWRATSGSYDEQAQLCLTWRSTWE